MRKKMLAFLLSGGASILTFALGLLLLMAGCWLVSPALALIVGGLGLIFLALWPDKRAEQ